MQADIREGLGAPRRAVTSTARSASDVSPGAFFRWLERERAHPVWGAFARAVVADTEWPREARTLVVLERYLSQYPQVSVADREALRAAWAAFEEQHRRRKVTHRARRERSEGRALVAAAAPRDPAAPRLVDRAVEGDVEAARALALLASRHGDRALMLRVASWCADAADPTLARRIVRWLDRRGAPLSVRQGRAEGAVSELLYLLNDRPITLTHPVKLTLSWEPHTRARCALELAMLAAERCDLQGRPARDALVEAAAILDFGGEVSASALLQQHGVVEQTGGGHVSAHAYRATLKALELAEGHGTHSVGQVAAEVLWAHHPDWWHVDAPDPLAVFGDVLSFTDIHHAMSDLVTLTLLDAAEDPSPALLAA